MADKKQEYKSLLLILATTCPEDCKAMLKKYNGEQPKTNNPKELEMKLGRMYAMSSQKLDIEKDLANIHPHKNFILKNQPVRQVEKEIPSIVADGEVKKDSIVIEEPKASDVCNCKCAQNRYSNADGNESASMMQRPDNQTIMMLSIVGIVAIFGMVLYVKK